MDKDKFYFKAAPLALDAGTDNAKRTFSGIAYSGDVIENHYWWGNVIFDIDSMRVDTPFAALLDHDTAQRVGVVRNFTKGNDGLKVEGDLLSNEQAQQVAKDSDDGFPWQMSVYIEPQSIEQVETGSVTVNGREIKAPITIFRGGYIREVSFCALGADSNTSAVAANTNRFQQSTSEEKAMDLEQAKARIAELEQDKAAAEQARDAAQTELTQFKAEQRTREISSLETELATTFDADAKHAYAAMTDDVFAFTVQQLRQFAKHQQPQPQALPQHLFTQTITDTTQPSNEHKFTAAAKVFAGVK